MRMQLIIPKGKLIIVMRLWLVLGVMALALAGILSLLLVLARTPGIQGMFASHDFFRPALAVHVDLSVLVWLLSICAMLWCSIIKENYYFVGLVSVLLSAIGTVLISVSPFAKGEAIMNNYIPVVNNPLFFIGLSLFICGIILQLITTLFGFATKDTTVTGNNVTFIAIYSSALITVISLVSACIAYASLRRITEEQTVTLEYFYEMLFWSCGHILQFTFTQIMQLAWLILATRNLPLNTNKLSYLFLANAMFAILVVPLQLFVDVDDYMYIKLFTSHMIYFGGVTPLISASVIIYFIYKERNALSFKDFFAVSLLSSILLFAIGGIIGVMISGANVTIPAHYHGSIVGVTIAFMGMAYFILRNLGFSDLKHQWLLVMQPYMQAIGQMLHIIGLAWSGGYGVLRKTPGAVFSAKAKLSMAMMGLGGVLAIFGGLLFVIILLSIIAANIKNINKVRSRHE